MRAGAEAAPLFIGLVLRAIEEARACSAERVWYLTREGTFFKTVHEQWCRVSGISMPSGILEVSRLSTFAASLRDVSVEELRRVWSLFSAQSPDAMLATLGCRPEDFRGFLTRAGLDPAVSVHHPWTDPRVQQLFADREFREKLDAHRRACRRGLLGYLAQHGIRDDGRPRVIVDIGWRGTIQDNIAWLLPSTRFNGIYLAMHIVLNQQPPNATKIPYAADVATAYERCARLLQHVQPLEMVCNSAEGSVRGYARRGLRRRWTALREPEQHDAAIHQSVAGPFQEGVLAGIEAWRGNAPPGGWTAATLRPSAFRALQRLIADPPEAMARAYFTLKHHEAFGLGATVDMADRLDPNRTFAPPQDEAARAALEAEADRSTWPCAFYRLQGLEDERAWFAREKLRITD